MKRSLVMKRINLPIEAQDAAILNLKQALKYFILTVLILAGGEKSFSQLNNYPHGDKKSPVADDRLCKYYLKNDTSDAHGKLVYDLQIDSIGNVVDIKLLSITVTTEMERKYKEEIRKVKFDLQRDNKSSCKGKIRLEYFFRRR